MPKLLHVTTVAATLRAFLVPYAQHFRRKGWQVDCLAQGAADSPECRQAFDQAFDIQWSRNPLDLGNLRSAPGTLRRIVAEGRYDIVHVHTPVAAFVTRWSLRGTRSLGPPRLVYTAHGLHFHKQAPWLWNVAFSTLERLAGRWTDRMVVINEEDYSTVLARHIVPPPALVYMPGIGIDLAQYAAATASPATKVQLRQSLGIPLESPVLLMIAAFHPAKRHQDLLQAFSRLAFPSVHLVLAGEGPRLDAMRSLARSLGLEGRVHFLGHRLDIPDLISLAVATVLPSEREGLPRSVMESMALGVPVVGADTRGTRDLLRRGGGLLYPVGDIDALRTGLQGMLADPGGAAALGAEGPQLLKDHDIHQLLGLHETLYGELLREGGTRPGLGTP